MKLIHEIEIILLSKMEYNYIRVGLGGKQSWPAMVNYNETCNGHLIPWFTKDVAEQVVAFINGDIEYDDEDPVCLDFCATRTGLRAERGKWTIEYEICYNVGYGLEWRQK